MRFVILFTAAAETLFSLGRRVISPLLFRLNIEGFDFSVVIKNILGIHTGWPQNGTVFVEPLNPEILLDGLGDGESVRIISWQKNHIDYCSNSFVSR